MEQVLYRYNPWWEENLTLIHALIERPAWLVQMQAHLDNKQVVFLTGLRRVGKTSLMKLLIRRLLEEGRVPPTHILYVSLDDYLLLDTTLLDLVEQYRTMHKLKAADFIYLFLDEITAARDYEIQLKNLYDLGQVKIFASSSSASLIKKQKGLLTGRGIQMEVLPLDFQEYLQFKEIVIRKTDLHLEESYFKEYLLTGGIPEYVLSGDDVYIRELVDDILQKDIAAVHGIRLIRPLQDFFLLLMERSGKTMSINKVAKVLGVSTETSKRYFDLFCDTHLIYPVSRHGKLSEQLVSPKKIYCCDTGIRSYYTGARDWGALFENYVFLRLKHLRLSYVYENQTELDLFTTDKQLIECKFYDEQLSEKQQQLFDAFKAKGKHILRSEADITALLARLSG